MSEKKEQLRIDKITFGRYAEKPVWEIKSGGDYYLVDFESGALVEKGENNELSKRVLEIEESVTLASDARAKKLKAEGKRRSFLTLGQPDFHTPENIQDAAVAAIRDGRASFYTVASGLPELKSSSQYLF